MTTLTASSPRRPGHCNHKLPTSCLLTALPICCACQDNRPHASSYLTYIDGVGFVPWGTRQAQYCWPCKEFWDARVEASGLNQRDTRILDEEDRLFDEPPYVVQALGRAQARTDLLRRNSGVDGGTGGSMYPHSQMFVTATAQRNDPDSAGSSATPDLSRPLRLTREHYRRVINLRRELERMRVSIDRVMTGLSTLNVAVPDTRGAVEQLTRLNVRLSRYQEAPLEEMPTAFESPIAGLFSRAYERHRQVQADREVAGQLEAETAELGRRGTHERSTARSVRIREEMRRAVAGVEARLAIDDVLENGTGAAGEATDSAGHQVWTPAASDLLPSLPNYLDSVNPDITPEMLQATTSWPAHPESASRAAHMIEHTGYESEDEDSQVTSEDDDDDEDYYDDYERENNGNDRESNDGHVKGRGLDKPDTDRPAAIEDEEGFKIDARCDICMGQIASMATFPCGHMVMCKWCAEIQMPTLSHARNVPRDRLSKCPVCRRKVKFIYNVYVRPATDSAGEKVEHDNGNAEAKPEQVVTVPSVEAT